MFEDYDYGFSIRLTACIALALLGLMIGLSGAIGALFFTTLGIWVLWVLGGSVITGVILGLLLTRKQ